MCSTGADGRGNFLMACVCECAWAFTMTVFRVNMANSLNAQGRRFYCCSAAVLEWIMSVHVQGCACAANVLALV